MINITQVAAGTTIAVNLLEIKANIHRVHVAQQKTVVVGKKILKKVKGK
jgi:hypothetical protein